MLPCGDDSLNDYIASMPDAVLAHDIAYDDGNIWVACDNAEHSIRCYDVSGNLVGAIERSLVPEAEGLTFDTEGCLWASDNVNGLIYRIDPLGTALTPATWGSIKAGD